MNPNLKAQGGGLALGMNPQALKGHLWFGWVGPTTALVPVRLVTAPSQQNRALSPPSQNALCPEAQWVLPPNMPLHLATLPVTVPAPRSRDRRKYKRRPVDAMVLWEPQRGKAPGRRGG